MEIQTTMTLDRTPMREKLSCMRAQLWEDWRSTMLTTRGSTNRRSCHRFLAQGQSTSVWEELFPKLCGRRAHLWALRRGPKTTHSLRVPPSRRARKRWRFPETRTMNWMSTKQPAREPQATIMTNQRVALSRKIRAILERWVSSIDWTINLMDSWREWDQGSATLIIRDSMRHTMKTRFQSSWDLSSSRAAQITTIHRRTRDQHPNSHCSSSLTQRSESRTLGWIQHWRTHWLGWQWCHPKIGFHLKTLNRQSIKVCSHPYQARCPF